ncbi:retrovirus-related pol polyprotein from transposon TNT 1-94 [Tanacetum coccineum]
MAPMALSDSEVKTCSKTCLTNYETLKKQYDDLIFKLHETEFKATTYKRGLATVEDQLVTFRKNEILFSEEIAVLKREVGCKNYEISVLKTEFEKVKQEKEVHPLIYNAPPKLDLSNSGLEEFQQPEFEGYRPKDSKNAVVNAVRTNQVNAVKASACWVWRRIKPNSASIILKRYDYVDARGRSRLGYKAAVKLHDQFDDEKRAGAELTQQNDKSQYKKLNTPVRNIRTDNGTEFVNRTLHSYYESVSISHETSVARSPQQNGVIERRNRTLVEAARNNVNLRKSSFISMGRGSRYLLVAAAPRVVDLADSPVSTSIDQGAPLTSIPSTQEQEHSPIISQGFKESPKMPHFHDDPLYESLHEDSTSQGSSSNVRPIHTPFESLGSWTKDHPIANVIEDPSRSVSMRKQLETDAMWCYFDEFLTSVEPKNFKHAMTELSWFDAIQEEIHEF